MILFVSYDLRSTRDYHLFYEVMKQQGNWWHYLASTWLLSTPRTPQQVVASLMPQMDNGDLLLVVELAHTSNYEGRLPKEAWDWINKELPMPAYYSPTGFNALLDAYKPTQGATVSLKDLLGTTGAYDPPTKPRIPGIDPAFDPNTVPTFPPINPNKRK
jgi:hypothetical protein